MILESTIALVFITSGAFAQTETRHHTSQAASASVAPQSTVETKPTSWDREPSSFFGIRFGLPLSNSIGECPKRPLPFTKLTVYVDTSNYEGPPCFENNPSSIDIKGVKDFFDIGTDEVNHNVEGIHATTSASSNDEIVSSLIQRFGPPQSEKTKVVQSKAGAQYVDHIYMWSGTDVWLQYETVGISVDEGFLSVTTSAYRDYNEARAKKATNGLATSY